MNNNGSRGGFFNGFLVGFIVGAAVVFCLFTKKGKKLLKAITEEGVEGISDLEELLEEKYEDMPKKVETEKTHTNGEIKDKPSAINKIANTGKRFFFKKAQNK